MKSRQNLGRLIGDFMRIASPKRMKITRSNLDLAFPEYTSIVKKKILIESYHNLGITLLEMIILNRLTQKQLNKYIKYSNPEMLHEVVNRGKGVIFLSGHFGNWEMMAFSSKPLLNIELMIVVKPQKNARFDSYINKIRVSSGNSIVNMYDAARVIIRTLKDGKILALLADQSATSDKDQFVDFFGIPAATYEAPASLALRFGSPLVMSFCIRNSDGTYNVEIREINHQDLENNPEGIMELTRRHVELMEHYIRQHPNLWSWQHRRWKHSVDYESIAK